MKLITWVLTTTIILGSSVAFSSPLEQKLDDIIKQEQPTAHISALVKTIEGETLYNRNANQLMYPASSTKLFTAAAALYHLGPDYRFITSLSQMGNDYYITFTGDPSLTVEKFQQLLATFKDIKDLAGNIILDTKRFQAPFYAGGVAYDDLGFGYAAPSNTVILNRNAVDYELVAKTIGNKVDINPKDANSPLTLVNELTTVAKIDAKEHCNFNIALKPHNTLRLYGCIAQKDDPEEIHFSIPNPVLFAKQLIEHHLKENGIRFQGKIIQDNTSSQAAVLSTIQSEPLSKLIAHMLQESDNLYADALTKTLGFAITKQGNYKQGVYAIKEILAKHTGLNPADIKLADGMGTRYDLASPENFTHLLVNLYQNEYLRPIVLEALPHMGVSGTLAARMKDTPLENKVMAKTGTFQDTTSLSGYLFKPNGKVIVFSIISNNVGGNIKKAKAMEDKILLEIFNAE